MMVSPSPTSGRVTLIGRARERQRLRDLLKELLAGHGRLALVSGEAGIGKTALVRDLVRQAEERGALVLVGGCYDLTVTPPYGPWTEVFGSCPVDTCLPRTVPALTQAAGRGGAVPSQADLFDEVREFVRSISAARPLVMVLEDLHWGDKASLDLLRFLARSVADLGIFTIVTYRDDELTRRHSLFQLLPLLARETDAVRLELQRLNPGAVRELVKPYALSSVEMTRLVAYLEKRAAGNPLFLAELLRALEADGTLRMSDEGTTLGELDESYLPSLVLQVIERRLAHLDDEARRALENAAVIGQDAPLAVWESVAGLAPQKLAQIVERALETHILEETADHQGVRFTHALVREVLYGSVVHTRRTLHQRVAEALIERAWSDPGAIAYHLQQAGDDRSIEWHIRAGLQARRSAAWLNAAEHFRAAAQLLERGHPTQARERGWLLFYTGFLLRFSGDTQALGYLDEAERQAVIAGDPLLSAYVHYHRGSSRCMRGDIRRGLAEIETGVTGLEELAESRELLSTEEQVLHIIQVEFPGSADSGEVVVPRAPRPPDGSPAVVQQRGILVNWLGHTGRYRQARQTGEAFVAAVASTLGEEGLRFGQTGSGVLGLGHAYAALGQPDSASLQYESARRGFASIGDHAMAEYTIWVELLMVTIPYRTDQIAERNRLLTDATHAWERALGTTLGAMHETLCKLLVDVLEGRWSEARRLAQQGQSAPNVNLFQGAIVRLGELARNQGEPCLAWKQISKLLPEGPETQPGDSYFPHAHAAQRLAAELALDAGYLELARRWVETHGRWQEWSGAWLWQSHHHLLLAHYEQMVGDLQAARRHAVQALERASDPRQPLTLIAAHRQLGEIETHRGRFADAEHHLGESLKLADACAAPYEQALTRLALAELWFAAGKHASAGPQLDQARELCIPLDAKLALGRIDGLASRLAAQAPRSPSFPNGLTPREAEVLRLIAAGRSNREMADDLFLSVRTVERHVTNIYRKIDARNRAEATAFALANNLADPAKAAIPPGSASS